MQGLVVVESCIVFERCEVCESDMWAVGERQGSGAVQRDDRGRGELFEFAVERHDLRPVGRCPGRGVGVECCDRGMDLERSGCAELQCMIEQSGSFDDRVAIPT